MLQRLLTISVLFVGGWASPAILPAQTTSVAPAVFESHILPLLEKYCADCHQPGAMKQFDFLLAKNRDDALRMKHVYASVARQIEQGKMPPSDLDQPSANDKKLLVDWIKGNLFDAAELEKYFAEQVSDYIVSIYEDKKGHLWFGTVNDGAARFDGKSIMYLKEQDGLPSNAATSFAEDGEGNIWIGTQEGICRYDGKSIRNFGAADGIPSRGGNVIVDRNGQLWANMYFGLYRYDGKRFVEFKLPIDKETLPTYAAISGRASIRLVDRHGNMWISTNGAGVFKFDGKSFTQFTQKDGLCTNFVTGILEDHNGNLWFSCLQDHSIMSGDGGLCRFDGREFTKFPTFKGLSNNDIYKMYEDRQGNLWVGATGQGVYRYDGQEFKFFETTDRMDLTWSLGLQSAWEDRHGRLWLGFSGGLFRFDGNSIVNVPKNDLLRYAPTGNAKDGSGKR